MLRILLIWILGIFIDYFYVIPGRILLEVLLLIGLISLLVKSPLKYSILVLIAWFGLSIVYNHSFFRIKHIQAPLISSFVLKISSQAKEKPKTWEVFGDLKQIKVSSNWETPALRWKVKCYFSKKMQQPKFGQVWLVVDSVKHFDAPIFPFEKDWGNYYAEKGIVGSVFVHAKNSKVLRPFAEKSIQLYLKRIQGNLLKSFQLLPSKVNREVAEAMVLGEIVGIDQDLQEAYTRLGAIHILSVSGMHLGILFLVIHLLFSKIQHYFPRLKTIVFLATLLVLWSYAGITGFSAPVLRATWVFTFILFARFFHFQINSLNLLASSCLVLLLINPYDLFNPGFQLSYLAVLGLILFQKPVVQCLTFDMKRWWAYLLHYFWESTAVAISAQILTLPLVIYYFYQMPNPFYFFLLNPVLMLLSSIALVASFVLLCLYPICFYFKWMFFAGKIGWIVDFSYDMMHKTMLYFSKGNESSIGFLSISGSDLLLIYICVFLLVLWLKLRRVYFLGLINVCLMYLFLNYTLLIPKKVKYQTFEKIVEFRKEWIGIKVVRNRMLVVGPSKYVNDRKWFSSHLTPMASHFHVRDTVLVMK